MASDSGPVHMAIKDSSDSWEHLAHGLQVVDERADLPGPGEYNSTHTRDGPAFSMAGKARGRNVGRPKLTLNPLLPTRSSLSCCLPCLAFPLPAAAGQLLFSALGRGWRALKFYFAAGLGPRPRAILGECHRKGGTDDHVWHAASRARARHRRWPWAVRFSGCPERPCRVHWNQQAAGSCGPKQAGPVRTPPQETHRTLLS